MLGKFEATMMGIREFEYRGSKLSRYVRENSVTTILNEAGPEPLVLVDAQGEQTALTLGKHVITPREKSIIRNVK